MSEEMSRVSRSSRNSRPTKAPRKHILPPRGDNNNGPRKHYFRTAMLIAVTVFAVICLAGAALFAFYASSAPKITNSQLVGISQSEILDKQGDVIWTSGNEDREIAQQSEFPPMLKKAVVSIEDRRFYKHGGIDPRGIAGAFIGDLRGSQIGLRGGSTLTQQLVKMTVFSTAASDQTLKRKAQEAWLAIKLEKSYSKNQILALYMNKVPMGNGVYGMKTAAKFYFGKDMNELTTPQMALLAGLPQSPYGYDPYTNPKGATERRNEVLKAMAETGAISKSEEAADEKVSINDGLLTTNSDENKTAKLAKVSDAYISSVLTQLKKKGYSVATDGIKVHTNLDINLQKKAYSLANSDLSPIAWTDDEVQVGATVVNPSNGEVMAQIGGRKQSQSLGLNRATQTSRSSGSTAKPLVDYGPAIEYLNWPTYRRIDDQPYTYAGTNIQVHNADGLYASSLTMRKALVLSHNTTAIRTLQAVGYNHASSFLDKLGIKTSSLKPADAIGINISTAQEATAYAAFDNGGTYYKPQYISSITERNGEVKKFANPGKRAMKASTAYMMTNMLESYVDDSYAKFIATDSYNQAGKTGTVNYDTDISVPSGAVSDSWFTGYTKAASISVWTGYDSPNDPGNYLATGGYSANSPQFLALNYYKNLMDYIMEQPGADGGQWKVPDTVESVYKYGLKEYRIKGASFTDPYATAGSSYYSSTPTYSSSTAPVISSNNSSSLISSSSVTTNQESNNTTNGNQSATTTTPGNSGVASQATSGASSATTNPTP